MEVVAETTPLFAWRGPLRVEMVRPPLKTLVFVNVFAEYVFGIVVDASVKAMADVVDHERPTDVKYCDEVVENARPAAAKALALEVEKLLAR
jgi:hypothetical protein